MNSGPAAQSASERPSYCLYCPWPANNAPGLVLRIPNCELSLQAAVLGTVDATAILPTARPLPVDHVFLLPKPTLPPIFCPPFCVCLHRQASLSVSCTLAARGRCICPRAAAHLTPLRPLKPLPTPPASRATLGALDLLAARRHPHHHQSGTVASTPIFVAVNQSSKP